MELNTVADALSGLQANQSYMDVVGDNIANVNTVGYKTQNIHFADLMSQTLSYGTAPNGAMQGTNPFQVGMGVGTGSISTVNTQGSVQETGRTTDMAIQGNGYFVLNNGDHNYYTRDGSFTIAPDGSLESPGSGMSVMGYPVSATTGAIDRSAPLGAIHIPTGTQDASPTTAVSLGGNLDASQAVYAAGPPATGGQIQSSLTVYDSLGNAHQLSVSLQKTAANTWSYTIAPQAGATDSTVTSGGTGTLTFDSNGHLTAPSTPQTLGLTFTSGATAGSIKMDFSGISQVAAASNINVPNSDGSPGGTISTFSVGTDGIVTAVYSNGLSKPIAQLALADFRNPDGLQHDGNNLYTEGVNSGTAQLGVGGEGTMGTIETGQLEGSNVDLAAQFAQMIQAQQGFNANTKVVTTTNNMLQSIISIIP